jgi:hypothetical protein
MGQLERFPAPVLTDRYLIGNPMFVGGLATGRSAPIADLPQACAIRPERPLATPMATIRGTRELQPPRIYRALERCAMRFAGQCAVYLNTPAVPPVLPLARNTSRSAASAISERFRAAV